MNRNSLLTGPLLMAATAAVLLVAEDACGQSYGTGRTSARSAPSASSRQATAPPRSGGYAERWIAPSAGNRLAQYAQPQDDFELLPPASARKAFDPFADETVPSPEPAAPVPLAEGGPYGYGPSGRGPYGCGPHGCGACGGCTSCGDCGHWGCQHGCGYWTWWDEVEIFGGTHAFKGPFDFGVNGNFGFHEGATWAGPLWEQLGIAGQVSFRAVHSNFEGTVVAGPDVGRDQFFLTAGLFRRTHCGWQGGFVVDILRDEYVTNIDLNQFRAELSYVFGAGELGSWVAVSGDRDIDRNFLGSQQLLRVEPVDQYNFFYRHRFCNGNTARVWGGFTGRSDAILGADFDVQLAPTLWLAAGFNYLIPDQQGMQGVVEESWNVGLTLVWYLGGRNGPGCTSCTPSGHGATKWYRPLFAPADNGSFMVDVTRP
jgi:hypothetical protein